MAGDGGRISLRSEVTNCHGLRAVNPTEDSGILLEDLREEGFSDAVIDAIAAVTKRLGEGYDDFVQRAASNPIGRRVKLADLADNSNLSRIAKPTDKDYERLAKYRRAIESIQNCVPQP